MLYLLFLVGFCVAVVGEAHGEYTSQWCTQQDKYLNENYFHNKRNGVFVDVGAHDGVSYSNSYFFEKELGWTGICIEPMPAVFAKLMRNRSCVCINSCVSPSEGLVDFVLVDDKSAYDRHFNTNMLSGVYEMYSDAGKKGLAGALRAYGISCSMIKLPSSRLSSILEKQGITHIDFLSVDTEGGELEILKTVDFKKVKVHIISVENNYNDPDIRTYLESQGFTFLAHLCQDEAYINHAFEL